MASVVSDWRRQHYAQVPAHGIDRHALEAAAQAFFAFLSLPEPKKEAICRTLPHENRIDIGYMRQRATEDTDEEEKMYFHYHPDIDKLFAKEIKAAGAPAKEFTRVARDIWERTLAIGTDSIHEFEHVWPGTRERFLPTGETPQLVIRFLAYQTHGRGDFLARPHYDRGTFTVALGESAPGLRVGTPQLLKEVEHWDGYVVVMPGTGFPTDIDPSIEPAWHDVVQKERAQLTADTARWAIVGFFDVTNRSYISIEDTHVPRVQK